MMFQRPLLATLAAASLALTSMPVLARAPQNTESARIARLLAQRAQVKELPAVALSHDGRHLAWIISHDEQTTLMLATGDGKNAHAVALGDGCHEEGIRWAHRADELAVLTRCKVDPSNTKPIHGAIWLVAAATGKSPHKLADLEGFASGLQWSHDDRHLAFLYVPGATRLPFATASANPRVGVIGKTNVRAQHIAEIPVAGGTPVILTPRGLYAYAFSLSPRGDELAYTAAPPPGDNNWWTAKMYVQAAKSDASPRVVVDPGSVKGSLHDLQMGLPRWSPDASHILFIAGLMSDRGATGGDIYRVPAAGGTPVNLTDGVEVTPSWFTFTGPHTLLVSQIASGTEQVADYALSGDHARPSRVWFTAPGTFGDGSAALALSLSDAPQRRIAYAAQSFDAPPEVHVGELSGTPPPVVTAINAGLTHTWGKARSVKWKSGGFRVQGWLLYPAHYDPHKTYPMVVYVHGGPSWANLPAWGTRAEALSEFGYFVLLPNPRGSFGEGEAFAQAIRNQMGYGDLDDILAGIDAVEKLAPIDDKRLGMMGWSYGGFMSMFVPTQTHRFKAVSAGAGISDWQSYYGENQIDKWMIPFFGASLYNDPKAYAKSSAINFIKHTDTPALVLVGERDEECPAPQSFEYWHALKTLGVPTTLVVYANEGHHIAQRKNQQDILRRQLDWFGKYLAASPG